MASKVGKIKQKKDSMDFVEGYKTMEIKNRKQPHYWKISKKLSRFDNDEVYMLCEDGDGFGSAEIGINKKINNINDDDLFDINKDGN